MYVWTVPLMLGGLLSMWLSTTIPVTPASSDTTARLAARDAALHAVSEHGVCACYAPGTPEAYVEMMQAELRSNPDYQPFSTNSRWSDTASGSAGGQGSPITLTYSFVPDGPISVAGAVPGGSPINNTLHATLDGQFGSTAAWKTRFRNAFDHWSELSGVNYIEEPNDDGATWNSAPGVRGVRGDVRIIAYSIDGRDGILAFNFFPNSGDMALDIGEPWSSGTRFMHNTLMHEAGHGIGLMHVTPLDGTKLMEAFLNTNFDGPQDDDIRGANHYYGDSFEPNGSNGAAAPLGAFVNNKTINASLHSGSDSDWYAVNGSAGVGVRVRVRPLGGSYSVGPDPGSPSPINTLAQQSLVLEVFEADGQSLLREERDTPAGQELETTPFAMPAGGFRVRVRSLSGGAVQRYELRLIEDNTVTYELELQSEPPSNVELTVSPPDLGSVEFPHTPRTLEYASGVGVEVTAPAMVGAAGFLHWEVDGAAQPDGLRTIMADMTTNHAALAVYEDRPVVNVGPDLRVAEGETVQLEADANFGRAPYTYEWRPSAGLSRTDVAIVQATPTGDVIYTCTVTDADGYETSDSLEIELIPALIADAGDDVGAIRGRPFGLQGSVSGGTPPYTLTWSPDEVLESPNALTTSATVEVDTEFTFEVTDNDGRISEDKVLVRVAQPLSISITGNDLVPPGGTATLDAEVFGGVAPLRYSWLPTTSLVAGQDTPQVQVMPERTTVYTLTVIDAIGQRKQQQFSVAVAASLSVTASSAVDKLLEGESTTLQAVATGGQPPYTYAWSPADSLNAVDVASVEATPVETTTYRVVVTDDLGMTAESEVTVSVDERTSSTAPPATMAPPCGFGLLSTLPLMFASLAGLRFGRRRATRRRR